VYYEMRSIEKSETNERRYWRRSYDYEPGDWGHESQDGTSYVTKDEAELQEVE
jgi:hypothetical protein